MCLSQANADLAEAAEKLEVIRKKLTVSLSLACSHSLSLSTTTSYQHFTKVHCIMSNVCVKCGGVG